MKFFIIYGINEVGQKIIDGFETENREQLYKILNNNNYIPLKIYETPQRLSFLKPVFTPSITTDQAIEVLDNLNVVLKAGIPINQGLRDIEEDTTNSNVKKVLRRISNEVNAGSRLSSATKPFEKHFTPTIINLMAIGEETGKLPLTLKNGADFLRKTESLKKNTKKALFTPIISIVLIILAIAAWMTFVVPGMVEFFKDMDTELPPLTLFLIDASAFVTTYGLSILVSVIIFFVIFRIFFKTSHRFRYRLMKFFLKIPVVSKLIKFFNIAFVMEYLHLSLHSGLTLYESLKLLRNAIANEVYQEDISNIIHTLEKGGEFSETTRGNPLYTNFVTRIVEIGETTGEMENELKSLADSYYERVDDMSALIPKIAQPAALLIGGGFMALIMLGLMGPIYDLIGNM